MPARPPGSSGRRRCLPANKPTSAPQTPGDHGELRLAAAGRRPCWTSSGPILCSESGQVSIGLGSERYYSGADLGVEFGAHLGQRQKSAPRRSQARWMVHPFFRLGDADLARRSSGATRQHHSDEHCNADPEPGDGTCRDSRREGLRYSPRAGFPQKSAAGWTATLDYSVSTTVQMANSNQVYLPVPAGIPSRTRDPGSESARQSIVIPAVVLQSGCAPDPVIASAVNAGGNPISQSNPVRLGGTR